MKRRYAEYRPARWYRPRYRLFRSVRFGVTGWAAVAVVCLAGAALGYGAGAVTGLPTAPAALAGALAVIVGLVALDRRRWGRISMGYSWGGTPEAVRHAVAGLRRAGVAVEVDPWSGTGIRFLGRDRRRVARGLAAQGIPNRLTRRRW